MKYPAIQKNTCCSGSTLVNFSFVLALIACLASGYLYFQWKILSGEKKEFGAVRVQLKDQITSLETDLQAALQEQQKLKQSAELESSDKAKTLAELVEVKTSSEQLRTDLEKLKKESASLKKLAVQLKTQGASLAKSTATDSPIAQTGGVAVSAVAEHLQAASTQPLEIMKVKTINRTFNFVVFDLVAGVPWRVGDSAVVERDGRWISDLKIKQVYAQFASAEIRKEDESNLLQIGDSVKRV